MSLTTKVSYVDFPLFPSLRLKQLIVCFYAMIILVLFFQTSLSLELKVMISLFLLQQAKSEIGWATHFRGRFRLDEQGKCRWNEHDYQIIRLFFITKWVVLIDVSNGSEKKRFPLFYDAMEDSDFRSISRVCLMLK